MRTTGCEHFRRKDKTPLLRLSPLWIAVVLDLAKSILSYIEHRIPPAFIAGMAAGNRFALLATRYPALYRYLRRHCFSSRK